MARICAINLLHNQPSAKVLWFVVFSGAQNDDGIKKDDAIRGNAVLFNDSFFGVGLNLAHKQHTITLPLVKAFVILVTARTIKFINI